MKSVILVLAFAALGSGAAPRDKRSYGHAHAYEYPISSYTVVQPSSSLPVYEYPESTQIDTHSNTVYSVSVPITHTVHLEQPSYSRQVIYHSPPAYNNYNYNYQHYQTPVYRTHGSYAHSYPWVYQRSSDWC